MAINSKASIGGNVPSPSGFTNPTPNVLVDPIKGSYSYTVAISGISHASDGAIGMTDLLTALEAHFEATQGPNSFGLDATKTITVNLTLHDLERKNSNSDIMVTGAEQYACVIQVEYTVA